MKGKDFVNSKWVQQGARPSTQKHIKNSFSKWTKKVSNTGLLKKAKQLYQYFLSSEITGTQKTLVAGALLYIISPLDLIPDCIPIAGWLDDLGVAGFTLNYIFSQMNSLEQSQGEELEHAELLESTIGGTGSDAQGFIIDVPSVPIDFSTDGQSEELQSRLDELTDIANTLKIGNAESFIANISEKSSSIHMLQLAVIGRYSTGKSTLINSLLSMNILPTSPTPTTKAITYILKGKKDSLAIEYPTGEIIIKDGVAELSSIYNDQITQARKMTISLEHFPFDHLAIVDTPGLEEPDQDIAQLTLNMVPEADAVVVLLDANYLQSKAEFEFISSLLHNDKDRKLFIVINKTDGKSQDDVTHLVNLCQSHLLEYDIPSARIYAISAKLAEADAGFKAFKKDLFQFLINDIRDEAKRHIENQVKSYSKLMLAACNLALEKAVTEQQSDLDRTTRLQNEIENIRSEYEKQKQKLGKKIAAYRSQFFLDFTQFMDSLKSSIRQNIMSAKLDTLKNTDDIARKIKQEIVHFVDSRINEINAQIHADVSESQNQIRLYLSQLSMHVDIKIRDYSAYSGLFFPAVITAGYFFYGGLMSLNFICLVIASVIGRNFFEKAIADFLAKVGINRVREKLLETIYPNLDKAKNDLEEKFNESFDALEEAVVVSYDTACSNAVAPLALISPDNDLSVKEIKKCHDRLKALSM